MLVNRTYATSQIGNRNASDIEHNAIPDRISERAREIQLTVSANLEGHHKETNSDFFSIDIYGNPLVSITGNDDSTPNQGMSYIESFEVSLKPTENAQLFLQVPRSTEQRTYQRHNGASRTFSANAGANLSGRVSSGSSNSNAFGNQTQSGVEGGAGTGLSAGAAWSTHNDVWVTEEDFKATVGRREHTALWNLKLQTIFHDNKWFQYNPTEKQQLLNSKSDGLISPPDSSKTSIRFSGSGKYKKEDPEKESKIELIVKVTTVFVATWKHTNKGYFDTCRFYRERTAREIKCTITVDTDYKTTISQPTGTWQRKVYFNKDGKITLH